MSQRQKAAAAPARPNMGPREHRELRPHWALARDVERHRRKRGRLGWLVVGILVGSVGVASLGRRGPSAPADTTLPAVTSANAAELDTLATTPLLTLADEPLPAHTVAPLGKFATKPARSSGVKPAFRTPAMREVVIAKAPSAFARPLAPPE
jgi:hypothetical protein